MTAGHLPETFLEWIGTATGGEVTSARRHLNGASRQAWTVDVTSGGGRQELSCWPTTSADRGVGSRRQRAARPRTHGRPVPRVVADNAELGAIVLERVHGRSDFPLVDDEAEREPTARDLMEITATLHSLDPALLDIDHLGPAGDATDHAARQLAHVEG